MSNIKNLIKIFPVYELFYAVITIGNTGYFKVILHIPFISFSGNE